MVDESDPRLLTLAVVAQRCEQETGHFFRRQGYDPRYCFDLFRRAVLNRDPRACDLLFAQYQRLVAAWVQRHPAFASSGEEVQYFVNRAFEKMWTALTPEKFARFADLKSLLRYLQLCVHSAVLDHARSREQLLAHEAEDAGELIERLGTPGDVESRALNGAERADLWRHVNERLHDEKERLVVYGSFVLALKPGELYAEFKDSFADVREVYRAKQNVLERLRRDAELKKYLAEDA